jgi:WhiB family redox-sensing transcriptional regulator
VTTPVPVLTAVQADVLTGSDEPTAVPAPTRAPLPCHTVDPDLWFAESPADVETAKALCLPCPRRQACLAGALERREPWGVWGGQLVLSGVVVPRKRPRGRPRKDEVAA